MMKISKKIIYLLLIIMIGLFAIYKMISSNSNNNIKAETSKVDYDKLNEIVFDVKTTKVIKSKLIKKISANGIVKANKELDVTPNINGVIKEIDIYEGKFVREKDLLIKLDDAEYKINLKEAEQKIIEAKVDLALLLKGAPKDTTNKKVASDLQNQLDELEQKYKSNQISDENYKKLKDKLEIKIIFTGAKREELILNKSGYYRAINAIDRAKLNLSYTNIKAPFSGVIGDFDLVVGQRVSAGEKLFKLFNINTLKIDINVLENEVGKIMIGSKAEIKLGALNNEKFFGKVINISPYVDIESRTNKVVISIKNIDNKIKPGMFAKVMIETETLDNRILIPREALLVRDKRNLVFIVEKKLAKWKYVKIGEQNDKYIEILNGVNVGDDVIVEGHFNLAHDSKVVVRN